MQQLYSVAGFLGIFYYKQTTAKNIFKNPIKTINLKNS